MVQKFQKNHSIRVITQQQKLDIKKKFHLLLK